MFYQSYFENLNLGGWNTSNVTDMSYMFCREYNLSQLNLTGWDTSKVENMSHMFDDSNAKVYDLSHFDTSKVKDMSGMFSSTTVPDISHFNTSNVENMSEMFEYANIFSDISNFDTSKVKNMYQMFYNVYEEKLNLTGWDTSNVENMSEMFAESRLTTIYVGEKWSVENVTKYKNMFYQSGGITGHVGTKYNAEYDALEYSRIDTPNEPGYFSLFINIKSDDYKIVYDIYPYPHRYIYTCHEELDINKITVDAGTLKKEGNKVNIYYNNEIIESYDIVTISSDVYQVGDGYIFLDNTSYLDQSLVNITNAVMKKEDWQTNMKLYYKNDQVERYIETISILNFSTSYHYDKEKKYIYSTNEYVTDMSKIKFYSGKVSIKNDKIVLSYQDEKVAEYRTFSYFSEEYDLDKDYIYSGPYGLDKSKINVENVILKEENDKLQIIVDDDIIREYNLISITSDEYEFNGNIIYTENGVVDKNKIDTINCTIEVNEEYVYVYHNDNLIESYRIVSDEVQLAVKIDKEINWLESTNVGLVTNNYNSNYNSYITKLESSNENILKIIDNNNIFALGIGEAIITITDSNGNIYNVTVESVSPYGTDYKTKNNMIIVNNFDETYDMFYEKVMNKFPATGIDIESLGNCQQTFCTGTELTFYNSYITSFTLAFKGDLSGDGDVDSLDLATMLNHISGKKELIGAHLEAAYLNKDEDIDSLDLAYLMNHIAGKEGY